MDKYYHFKDKKDIAIGYARVSSSDNRQQLGLEVQKEALSFCDIIFIDKESGSLQNRDELLQAIRVAKKLRKQNKSVSIVVYKLDRLTRRMFALVDMLQDFAKHHIQLVSIQENIDTQTLTGKLLVVLLGYVAEMELEAISSRTKDGLRKARERGAKLGNPGISKELEKEIILLYSTHKIKAKEISSITGVSIATIYNVLHRNKIPLKSKNSTKLLANKEIKE